MAWLAHVPWPCPQPRHQPWPAIPGIIRLPRPTPTTFPQQAEVLAAHLPCAVGRYVGEMGVDLWDSRRWGREWERHGVLVMTPQILLNLLTHAIIPVSDGWVWLGARWKG